MTCLFFAREAAMQDRTTIERTLRNAYAARVRGDSKGVTRHFAADAAFQMMGSPKASPIASHCAGERALCSHLEEMIAGFELRDQEILSMIIDGSKAAVHWRAKVRVTGTNKEEVTELFDLIEFKDGQITSFREFCDTALAAQMMQP